MAKTKTNGGANLGFEATLWTAADKLRNNMDAADLVKHWEARVEAMETQVPYGGKAMVVCMSRRICVELYEQIRKLKPDWHSDDDKQGVMKVVMTGSADDPVEWQGHIRSKDRREKIANQFKDPKAPFKIVLVRDMWLTGFDVPCLTTMYVDKPMRGHALMQAIARVNRVLTPSFPLGRASPQRVALFVSLASQRLGSRTSPAVWWWFLSEMRDMPQKNLAVELLCADWAV